MKHYWQLLRGSQWSKNFLLFAPLFFSRKLLEPNYYLPLLMAFVAFSCLASVVYILNDYRDRELDRLHPKKRFRPLASGSISPKKALVVSLFCLAAGLSIAFSLELFFAYLLLLYLAQNIAYSLWLKHWAVLDVSLIGLGFVIRIFAGGIVSQTPISKWLIMMTFLLSVFIALAKRRSDLILLQENAVQTRKAIEGYSLDFVQACIVLLAAVLQVAYLLYTTAPETILRFQTENLYLTAFWVLVGLMRYLQLTIVYNQTESPTRLIWQDKPLFFICLAWILHFFWLIYG